MIIPKSATILFHSVMVLISCSFNSGHVLLQEALTISSLLGILAFPGCSPDSWRYFAIAFKKLFLVVIPSLPDTGKINVVNSTTPSQKKEIIQILAACASVITICYSSKAGKNHHFLYVFAVLDILKSFLVFLLMSP